MSPSCPRCWTCTTPAIRWRSSWWPPLAASRPSRCRPISRFTLSLKAGPTLPRWNWIEDWLLPPAVAVLHSAWLGLWVLWSVRAVPPEIAAPPVSPVVLWLLFLAAALVTRRLAEGADEPALNPRLALAGLGVLAVFGATWLTYGFGGERGYFAALVDLGNFISPVFVGV